MTGSCLCTRSVFEESDHRDIGEALSGHLQAAAAAAAAWSALSVHSVCHQRDYIKQGDLGGSMMDKLWTSKRRCCQLKPITMRLEAFQDTVVNYGPMYRTLYRATGARERQDTSAGGPSHLQSIAI
ncbi:hypothetical protein AXG93_3384s1360 [Marchantia polymorpha subsp. ruderalis]|uniref:Uncharacterized protein n=1 Tax=Marchantia polymorpha subsp. ruderalis TaxID=1480154 RepID=A0A176WH48_MARPO|nr:hypothetical protein AXG93_3384s1360 [Marchantia polymorpha subsp. ruderalis]